jgi:hypothetical protein
VQLQQFHQINNNKRIVYMTNLIRYYSNISQSARNNKHFRYVNEPYTHMSLSLSAKELLTTTRAVRKRLDLTRPVEREVIEECISIAQQAPTASNMQNWHFVVITDPTKKTKLAELFRKGWETYIKRPTSVNNIKFEDPKQMLLRKELFPLLNIW